MKKRKILYLFPLAALVLSGCTLQEGWDVVKDFSVNKIYEPVRDFFLNLFGKEVPKKEDEEKPSGEGEGEGGGEHEGETSKYGTLEHPLTVSEAVALIGEAAPTEQEMFVTGTVRDNEAWSTDYGNTSINLTDGTSVIKVFRVQNFPAGFDKEGIKQNSMKGQTVVAKGFGDKYNSTFELTEPEVLSITGEAEKPEEVDNYGTAENPLTVSQAIEVIKKQDPTLKPLFVIGEVSKNAAWSTQFGNVDIYITDGTAELELFRTDKFPQGFVKEDIKEDGLVGATVVATGTGMYYADGKKYELKQGCEVLSIQEQVIEITGVELSQSELSLEVGQQATLTAKVLPEDKASQEVTWTVTTNDAPAEVISCNNGTIVAKAAGTAVVTATSVADPSKTAECTVTVKEATKTLQSIHFEGQAKTGYNEDEAYTAEGLKVMADYDIGDDVDVTADATITISKEKAALGDTSITITASYGSVDSITMDVAVTVAEVNQIKEAYEAAEALENKAESETVYTFKGVVVGKRGTDDYFVQSGSYGLDVYRPGNEQLAVGKSVKVKSNVKKFSGTLETGSKLESIEILGDGTMPEALAITSKDVWEAAKFNILAKVSGTAKAAPTKDNYNAYTVNLDVNGDTIVVYAKSNVLSSSGLAGIENIKAGDSVEFNNLVTGAYNANLQLLACENTSMTVEVSPANVIKEIVSVEGPQEVELNAKINTSDVKVTVKYGDDHTGEATVKSVTVDTSTAGQKTADVVIEGWSETLHFNVTVKEGTTPVEPEKEWKKIEKAPEAGKDYKLILDRETNASNPGLWFITGKTESEAVDGGKDYYLATSQSETDAAAIELVATDNGFKVKIGTRYLFIGVNGTYTNSYLKDSADDATELTYDLTYGFGATISDKFWGLGTRNDKGFTTAGAVNFTQYPNNYKVCLYELVESGQGGGGGQQIELTQTITYSGSTSNMDGTNQAALLGVTDTNLSVVGTKLSGSNNVGLNKDGTLRVYQNSQVSLTISVAGGTISNIVVNVSSTNYAGTLTVNDAAATLSGSAYTVNVNSSSAVLLNTHATQQMRITSIVVTYVMD